MQLGRQNRQQVSSKTFPLSYALVVAWVFRLPYNQAEHGFSKSVYRLAAADSCAAGAGETHSDWWPVLR